MIDTPRNTYAFGDSLDLMPQLVADESVDLILTDPPFGIGYQSSRRAKKFSKIANDETLDWFPEFLMEAYRVLKRDRHCYIFCDWRSYPEMYRMVRETPFDLKAVFVWDKLTHGSGDLNGAPSPCHEFILFLAKGRREWTGSRPDDILRFATVPNAKRVHPTQKPLKLLEFLIILSTEPNELVLDPFMGSGSTCVAAKNVYRDFLGIEISSEYAVCAKERLRQGVMILNP